jgi:hypothetical protein
VTKASRYFALGMGYLYAGQEEKAIEAHKKLVELHPWAAVMDEYETLREDPRFEDFLARLNLPE